MAPTSKTVTAALLSALASLSVPQAAWSQGEPAGFARAPAATAGLALKRLPADRTGLTFRGESDSRSFAVFMTRQEADKVGDFRLVFVNAVSVQPDRSNLRLSINGRQLATIPVRSSGHTSTISVKIPPGTLVPGVNAVSIGSTLAHRVDCSVKATYELWTSIEPAETGFVIPATAASSGRTVADIGAEPLAADGTTRIHVRLPDHPDAASVERSSRLVSRLVAEAHIARPLVDVGPEPGSGPGFDVAVRGSGAAVNSEGERLLLRRADLDLIRDAASGRLTVVGQDAGSVAEAPAELGGDPAALAMLGRRAGQRVTGAGRISFDDLGHPDDAFSGRHLLRDIRIHLPADFYPGSYDKARILLDGAYAGDLDGQSSLVFRVNGALVSTLKLRSGSPGRFEHETVELPMQFFRPGPNDIAIEGTLNAASDAACEAGAKPEAARLMISGSSEIEFPYLAHLATMPQIAGVLSPAATGAEQDVYLLGDGSDAIGSALTVLANLAANGEGEPSMRLHLAPPGVGDRPGIVLGASDQLPTALSRAVDGLTQPRQAATAADGGVSLAHGPASNWRERTTEWFRQRGFFFAGMPDRVRRLPVDDRTLVVASIRPDENDLNVAGVELPRFTADGRQWLVFTAKTSAASAAGIGRLVADGLWPRLNGEAAALGIDDGTFSSMDSAKLTYVLPRTVRIADLRPVMGGLMSSNITLTAALSILLLSLLGLTMHGLLRTDRRRPK